MTITTVKTNITNDSIYRSITITEGKTKISFLRVKGYHNYVSIKNVDRPFAIGKDFPSFDHAQRQYKSPKIQAMILIADAAL